MAFSPFDYGNAIAKAEQIKGQRLKNAIAQRDLELGTAGANMVGKYNPGDYTPDSWAQAYNPQTRSVDANKLVRYTPEKTLIKVDAGDKWEFRHPYTQQLIGTVPKALAPKDQPKNVEDIAAAGARGKLNEELKLKPPVARATSKAGALGKAEGEQEADLKSSKSIGSNEIRASDSASVIDEIDWLLSSRDDGKRNLSYAYGRSNVVVPDTGKPKEWIDAEASRDRIISNLQLENVQKLKGTGPITENEQKILRAAATVLANPLISDQKAEKELRRVRTMFAKWKADADKAAGQGKSLRGDVEPDNDPLGIR